MIYTNQQPQQQGQQVDERALRAYPDTKLMPDNSRNRQEWARAVAVVRDTENGWLLDQPVSRRQA